MNLHPAISQAVVLAREDVPGSKRLVAYIVLQPGGDQNEFDPGLKLYLRQHLPEFMVPASFVYMKDLPLTANGKIDRKALPVPEYQLRPGLRDLIPPATKEELVLADIWKSLLGLEQVGVNENFFELGGDSILSIQLVARAGLENIQITPKQVFEHPTIAGLAAVAGQEAIHAEQGLVTGEVPLSPIQRRFFEHHLISPDHWNTSMMLAVFHDIDLQLLKNTIKIMLEQHDALRILFLRSEQGWQQFNRGMDIDLPVTFLDLTQIKDEAITVEVEKAANLAQQSLNLQNGPLMQVIWIRLPDGIPSRLLFIFHHSIFDGVSWRIFIEDFQSVYAQLAQQKTPMLLPKTTSYKEWTTRLYQYAQTDEFIGAISTWELIPGEIPLLPVDYPDGSNKYGDSCNIVMSLSLEETELLVKEAPGKFHSQVNEIMIALLARTLSAWLGSRSILVELYGHGREPIFSGVDISRTIGWFTTAYPVFLDLADADSITEEIGLVTEQLRRIPDHGISFGMLKFLTEDLTVRTTISAIPSPQVNFNYLGQFDQSTPTASEDSLLPVFPAPESRGEEQNPENDREAQLFIVASVTGGEMNIYWNYSAGLYKPETIQILANTYLDEIRKLLEICKVGK
jgi:non-ribosomal peptide synthase protein (TIGR01720 family)